MKRASSILLRKDIAVGFVEGVQGRAEGSRRATEKYVMFQPAPALETVPCRRILQTVPQRGVTSAPYLAAEHWLSCRAYIAKFSCI